MGQVRNAECERIDEALREMFPAECELECRQDTYTLDYIIWVTSAEGEVFPVRITLEEYQQDDWKGNVRQLLSLRDGADPTQE